MEAGDNRRECPRSLPRFPLPKQHRFGKGCAQVRPEACTLEERPDGMNASAGKDRTDSPLRDAGKFHHGSYKELRRATAERLHEEGGGEAPRLSQMGDHQRQLFRWRDCGRSKGGSIACLPSHAFGPNCADRRLNEPATSEGGADSFCKQLPCITRQIIAQEELVTYRRDMAEAADDRRQRASRQLRPVVFEQDQNLLLIPNFREGRGNRAGDAFAGRNQCPRLRASSRCNVDEVSICKYRRTRNCDESNLRLVLRQRLHDRTRRCRTVRQGFGQGKTDFRRGIVEQKGHRHFGGVSVDAVHIRCSIGSTESARGACTIARFRRFHPAKKCLYDHLRPTRHRPAPMGEY